MDKANLFVLGLSKLFTDKVCRELAESLEMFYANVQEILEFELMDLMEVESVCGVDYLLKQELSIVRRVSTYDNTIVNGQLSALNHDKTYESVKQNCLIIYLQQDKDSIMNDCEKEGLSESHLSINDDLFEDRDSLASAFSDVIVNVANLDISHATKKVIDAIVLYYSKKKV